MQRNQTLVRFCCWSASQRESPSVRALGWDAVEAGVPHHPVSCHSTPGVAASPPEAQEACVPLPCTSARTPDCFVCYVCSAPARSCWAINWFLLCPSQRAGVSPTNCDLQSACSEAERPPSPLKSK